MVFLSVKYVEGKPATYEGIEARYGNDEAPVTFFTGDPMVDYLTAASVAFRRFGPDTMIQGSSSLDHFGMDGGVSLEAEASTPAQRAKAKELATKYMVDHELDAIERARIAKAREDAKACARFPEWQWLVGMSCQNPDTSETWTRVPGAWIGKSGEGARRIVRDDGETVASLEKAKADGPVWDDDSTVGVAAFTWLRGYAILSHERMWQTLWGQWAAMPRTRVRDDD